MTTFKDELEKIIQDLQNGDGFSHAFPKAPLSDRSIAATQAIIELVDREIIETDEEVPEWGKLRIDCRNTLRAEQRAKLGVKNNE